MVAVVVNVQCKCTGPIVHVSPFQLEGNMAPSSSKLAPAPWRSANHVAANAKKKACTQRKNLGQPGPAGPARDFRLWLLTQYSEGVLTASRVCLGAWHLGTTAAEHNVQDLARGPGEQSGSYAKHLNKVLGLDKIEREFIFHHRIPQTPKQHEDPELLPHPFLLPHRQASEFAQDCQLNNKAFASLPIYSNLELLWQEGPLSLHREGSQGCEKDLCLLLVPHRVNTDSHGQAPHHGYHGHTGVQLRLRRQTHDQCHMESYCVVLLCPTYWPASYPWA